MPSRKCRKNRAVRFSDQVSRLLPSDGQLGVDERPPFGRDPTIDPLTVVSLVGRPWCEWYPTAQQKAIDELMGATVDLNEDDARNLMKPDMADTWNPSGVGAGGCGCKRAWSTGRPLLSAPSQSVGVRRQIFSGSDGGSGFESDRIARQ